jgi:hypothetical integral membrane protein (TIGR02206 family)
VVAATLALRTHLLLGAHFEHTGADLTGSEKSRFPHHEFLGFWSIHLLVVWAAAIYLTCGRRMRPQWRSYRIAVLVTVVWAAATFTFNSIAGTDYGFLSGNRSRRRHPPNPLRARG